MVATPEPLEQPSSPALSTSTRPTSLDHGPTMEITSALPDLHPNEAQTPDSPVTPEKEDESDGSAEGPPAMSSPVQFIGINYFPPSPIDVQQTTSQPRAAHDPVPWESGAASPLSEDYVVVELPTFPPKPCVLFFSQCLSLEHPCPSPHIPIHCSFLFCSTHALECSTGKARRGGVPVSAYRFGPPGQDSVYYTPPMGRIGVHHPREIVRVERDYTGGEIVQFMSAYPMELEGRVSLTFLRGNSHLRCHGSLLNIHADHTSAVHGKHQCYQRDPYIGL